MAGGRRAHRRPGAPAPRRATPAWLARLARIRAGGGSVTPIGWSVLVVGVAALVAGLLTDWAELLALGAFALVALLVAGVQAWGASTYDVELDLAARRVTQGERVLGRVLVRNAARRRLLPAQLELPVGGSLATFPVSALGPGAVDENVFRIPTTRRAVLTVGPAATVRSDAAGLVRRRRTWTPPIEVIVHPRTIALGQTASGLLRDLEGGATPSLAEVSLEFHALREYVPGDDVRRIHWRSTARLGQVMVRQDEDVRRTRTAVVLATGSAGYAGEEDLELAVSVAASWVVQAVREERDVIAHAGRAIPVATSVAALDAFSAVEATSDGFDVAAATAWVAREVPDASMVVLVMGARTRAAQVRAALHALPVDAVVVAVSCDVGAEVEVATDGHQTLARCGDLASLPGLVRGALP